MHRGPWALVPPLPFAAAIDASLWRRTTGTIRPRVLTPESYRLRGMWRWQEARGRNSHSRRACFIRGCGVFTRSFAGERRHDLAREAPQLLLAAEQRQDDVFAASALKDFKRSANLVRRSVERVGLGALRRRRVA